MKPAHSNAPQIGRPGCCGVLWRNSFYDVPLSASEALRVGGKPSEPGTPSGIVQGPERASSQVVVEKRDRRSFDDPKLRLLSRVRRSVRRSEQPEQELRAACQPEVRRGRTRRVDRVGRTLD